MKTNCRSFILVLLCLLHFACTQKNRKDAEPVKKNNPAANTVDFVKYHLNDLSTAENMKDILCQTWDNREDQEDNLTQLASTTIIMVSRGFSFFPDGTVVKNPRGDYRLGTWVLNDQKTHYSIGMKFFDGGREEYQLAMITASALTLTETGGSGQKLVDYVGRGISYQDPENDPFAPTQNKWRIKPGKPESDHEIKDRLKSNIRFFVRFYDHEINTNAATVIISTLPSCYKWYAGGIFLYKQNEIPVSWINCFYSQAQAMKGYKMAEDLLSKKYTWPKGETNWLKQNVAVLKQMENKL